MRGPATARAMPISGQFCCRDPMEASKAMKEPKIEQLQDLDDEQWARALNLFYQENHRQITDLQWTLILAGFGHGEGKAIKCYHEAVRRLRPTMKIIKFRPTLDAPIGEQPVLLKMKAGKKASANKRKDWEGHNICSLIRWMGKEHFDVQQTLKALTGLNLPAVEATVRIQLRKGQKNLAVPTLTEKQASTLKGIRQ